MILPTTPPKPPPPGRRIETPQGIPERLGAIAGVVTVWVVALCLSIFTVVFTAAAVVRVVKWALG